MAISKDDLINYLKMPNAELYRSLGHLRWQVRVDGLYLDVEIDPSMVVMLEHDGVLVPSAVGPNELGFVLVLKEATERSKPIVTNNIRRLRILSRLTQAELAHLLGQYLLHEPKPEYVSLHENSARRMTAAYLNAYSRVFKVPTKFIYDSISTELEFMEAVNRWYTDNGAHPID